MIVFLNLDGTARIVSPERVFQGSSVNIVSAIYAGATNTPLQIAFTLPNKVVTQYAPMSYNVASQEELAGVWEYKIPQTITEKTGTVGMTICATLPNGKQTSYNLTFNVEYAVLPQLPSTPDQNVYDLILQYLAENQAQLVQATTELEKLDEEVDNQGNSIANLNVRVANLEDLPTDGHGLGMFESVAQLKSMYPTAQENDYAAIAGGNIWIYKNGQWTDTGKAAVFSPTGSSVVQTSVVQDLSDKQKQQARDNILSVGPAVISGRTYRNAANSIIDFVSYAPEVFVGSEVETNYIKLCELWSIRSDVAPVVNIKLEGMDTNSHAVSADIHITTRYVAGSTPRLELVDALQRTEGNTPVNVWVECGAYLGGNAIMVYTECFSNQKMSARISAVGVTNRFEEQAVGGRGYSRAKFITSLPTGLTPTTLLPSIAKNTTDIAKNLYNLGAFDTYTSNGNATGTVSRKTGYFVINSENITELVTSPNTGVVTCKTNINLGFSYPFMALDTTNPRGIASNGFIVCQLGPNYTSNNSVDFYSGSVRMRKDGLDLDGYRNLCPIYVQYIIAEQYQYEEQVIENQPIHHLNQEGEDWIYREWLKGLNLFNGTLEQGAISALTGELLVDNTRVRTSAILLQPGTYTISVGGSAQNIVFRVYSESGEYLSSESSKGWELSNQDTFTLSGSRLVRFVFKKTNDSPITPNSVSNVMLSKGAPYPYEPYYGKIVREKDLQTYPVPPAVGEGVIRFDETSPATYYSNTTWERIAQGRMLIGANSTYPLGSTGGSADAVVVQHEGHLIDGDLVGYGDLYKEQGPFISAEQNASKYGTQPRGWEVRNGNEMYPAGRVVGESGVGKNLPPYLAVNYWKRIS